MRSRLQRYFLWCIRSEVDLLQVVQLTANEIVENAKKLADETDRAAEPLSDKVIEMTPGAFLSGQVARQLALVTDREAAVLRLRFALESGYPCSLETVGAEFGVTSERIRQIQVKAMHKLRRLHRIGR